MDPPFSWYVSRLSRMSPAEILHRTCEQSKKLRDRRRHRAWSEFGNFPGPIDGIPGIKRFPSFLDPPPPERLNAIRGGRLELLNQEWPAPTGNWIDRIWQLDPVSGLRWPGNEAFAFDSAWRHASGKGDVKFVWEINRLGVLQELAAAGSEECWTLIREILKGWMGANVPFRGVNWASGIEAASRLASIFVVLGLADGHRRNELLPIIAPFVEAHARWIERYPSLYSSANNHRISELAALFLSSACVPGLPHAARYRRLGQECLPREMARQFHSDGVGAEQSPTYAAYSLEWFTLAGIAADALGQPFPNDYRERAVAAVTHMQWMLDDAERCPRIGDDDEGRVLAFHSRPYVASVVRLAAQWLDLKQNIPIGTRTFRSGGYTVMREPTNRGTILVVFDHGPLGFHSIAAHGHADALSVWLHWGEEPIFVDAGTYLYHSGGSQRDQFRGTALHNTLSIEGADQSLIVGPFAWSRHARTRLLSAVDNIVAAENNGFERRFGLRHRRVLQRTGAQTFRIADSLVGRARRPEAKWTIGFLVEPGIEIAASGSLVCLKTPAGRRVRLTLEGPAGEAWRTKRVAFSPGFNRISEAVRIEASGTITRNSQTEIVSEICLE